MPSAEEVTSIADVLMSRGDCSERDALDFLSVCPVDVMRSRSLFDVNVANFSIFCRGLKVEWIRYTECLNSLYDLAYFENCWTLNC